MGLKKQAVDDLAKLIDLNDNEKESIKQYSQGEALFVCGARRMRINVVVSYDEEEWDDSFFAPKGYELEMEEGITYKILSWNGEEDQTITA